MTRPIVFRPVAHAELTEAALYYERQRAGLGGEWLAAMQSILDTIATHPERFVIALNDVREALVPRFPYAVYFRVKPDRIVVIAVFHTARDPQSWQSRSV